MITVRKDSAATTEQVMETPTLYISRDAEMDWLTALPLGHVTDGQPEGWFLYVGEQFRWCLDGPAGRIIGFELVELRDLDVDGPAYAELWQPPLFDAPLLALTRATAAEIAVAARTRYEHESTLNRVYFDRAVQLTGESAVEEWWLCLESGDSMAHYGLGYTLLELGEAAKAHSHLRHYVEIVPTNSWAWCWLGKACEALGDAGEARAAYRRAVMLEEAGSYETDAQDLLDALEATSQRGRE